MTEPHRFAAPGIVRGKSPGYVGPLRSNASSGPDLPLPPRPLSTLHVQHARAHREAVRARLCGPPERRRLEPLYPPRGPRRHAHAYASVRGNECVCFGDRKSRKPASPIHPPRRPPRVRGCAWDEGIPGLRRCMERLRGSLCCGVRWAGCPPLNAVQLVLARGVRADRVYVGGPVGEEVAVANHDLPIIVVEGVFVLDVDERSADSAAENRIALGALWPGVAFSVPGGRGRPSARSGSR